MKDPAHQDNRQEDQEDGYFNLEASIAVASTRLLSKGRRLRDWPSLGKRNDLSAGGMGQPPQDRELLFGETCSGAIAGELLLQIIKKLTLPPGWLPITQAVIDPVAEIADLSLTKHFSPHLES